MASMKNCAYVLFILKLFITSCSDTNEKVKQNNEIEQKVNSILSKMTLAEKAGQMTQLGVPAILVQD